MAASAFYLEPEEPEDGSRRRRSGLSFGAVVAIAVAVLAAFLALTLLRGTTISERHSDMKTTRVVLPPPPPPPPPEVKQVKPPEPKPTPLEQPADTPPPPSAPAPAAPAAPGADALTAREGAGPSSYGLAIGDGSGSRAGGKVGGFGGFNRAAYASYLEGEIKRAMEADKALRSAALKAKARVWIDASGKITRVEVDGSERAETIRAALVGRAVRPPDPSVAMPVALSLDIRRAG
ncbi:TonB-dependent receptor [Caulobacter soli]|uniref:TonB-dependent receptor n=1 Tax=Caulobacter soli TaxID=2708539 RepID=UPI0013ECCF7F|nr:TonB-dependent receptor [Caulobacter soli]